MPEFFERYGSEAKCRQALAAARWPNGFVCPACGGAARTRYERAGLAYWQCGDCQHQTSLINGTIFEASKLPLSRWFLAMQLFSQSKNNISALELRRQLGASYRSAWLMKHKILEAMRLAEDDRRLDGRVGTGRGADNKVPFVAAVQTTAAGHALYACLRPQPPTSQAMVEFDLNVVDIGVQLGFQEGSAFRRAFKGWSETQSSEYRRRQTEQSPQT